MKSTSNLTLDLGRAPYGLYGVIHINRVSVELFVGTFVPILTEYPLKIVLGTIVPKEHEKWKLSRRATSPSASYDNFVTRYPLFYSHISVISGVSLHMCFLPYMPRKILKNVALVDGAV